MSDKTLPNLLPVSYVSLIPRIVGVGRQKGYAIAVHGSMSRDLDLVACPWVVNAAPADELVEAIRSELGGYIFNDGTDPYCYLRRSPQPMPHGRLAWSIYLGLWPHVPGRGPYIDISVMPRLEEPNQNACDPEIP